MTTTKTTIGRGEYSSATDKDGSIILAFYDGRADGPVARRFQDQSAHDLWWSLNGVAKFGLTRKLPAVWARWTELLSLVPEMAANLQENMEQTARDADDTDTGMMEAVSKMEILPATSEEPAMPGYVLIDVPAKAKPALDALVEEINARAALAAEVEEAEAKAGWDPNP